MGILLTIIYALVVLPKYSKKSGREKIVYAALSLIAVISAYFAGHYMMTDHVGASLSGMLSIFMR